MNNFCLLPEQVSKLKKDFADKKVSVIGLMNMSTKARTEFFSKYAGESAKDINLAFEQKLILKHRVQGVVNLLSKVTESGKYSPETIAKLNQIKVDFRAKQQERLFSPAEGEQFLQDAVDKAFGSDITEAEAKQLFEIHKKSQELFTKYDTKKGWDSPKAKAEYGASAVAELNYTSELKGEGTPWRELLSNRIDEFKAEPYKPKAIAMVIKDAAKVISENSIALVASVDNSFLGRQGIKVLMTNPSVWLKTAQQSFINMYKELGGKNAMDALMADVLSSPNYINGQYETAGILDIAEEQYPTSLPEQIPYLGRVFRASEVAFKGSAITMRKGVYDIYSDLAKNGAVEMDKTQIQDLGKIVNSLTARGKWGKHGESAIVKLLLWSPRMIKANLDILTAHGGGVGLKTPLARKIALKNWFKIIGTLAVSLGLINEGLRRGKIGYVELDPLSGDFAKVVVDSDSKWVKTIGTLTDLVGVSSNTLNGKTTFDLTGGMGSYVPAIAKQVMNKSKSSTTLITSDFGPGFGEQTRFGAAIDFFTGKTTPVTKTVIDFAKGKNFKGQVPTIGNATYGIAVPISIQNTLGIFGIMSGGGKDWNMDISKDLQQFKDKIGNKEFDKANQTYNDQVTEQIAKKRKESDYLNLSNDEKQKVITKIKKDVQKNIFDSYNFKPSK